MKNLLNTMQNLRWDLWLLVVTLGLVLCGVVMVYSASLPWAKSDSLLLNQSKYVLVPWQAAKFNFEQRTATVNITQSQFQQVPTFTTQTWPNVWAPGYQERIYGYYGLRPGPERRMERRDIRR